MVRTGSVYWPIPYPRADQILKRLQELLSHPPRDRMPCLLLFGATGMTVLQQQTKALQEERPETGAEVSKRLESVKHLLWHGNTEEALERLSDLMMDLSLIQAQSGPAKKVADGLSEF